MGIVFGGWPEAIHSDFEQVKRIDAGLKLKKKVVSFDPDARTMSISGSAAEPYCCDLKECNCSDFSFRQAPCKHMYCLADELGLLEDRPKYKKGSGSFDPAAELDRYRELYESGQISADAYVKICTPLAKMKK